MTAIRMSVLALGAVLLVALFTGSPHLKSVAATNYEELALLTNVLHLVRHHYVKDVDEHLLVEGALKGMLDVLDPHTSFLSKDLYREVQSDTRGEFEGLGIEITKRDGFVTVVSPIDGTPASRAGIRARDQIVAVCPDAEEESCQSTHDMNLLEAVKLMRGKRGTKIMIRVMRESWTMPRPFVLQRASIRVSSVTLHMVKDGLPYIRISQFQERSSNDLADALEKARDMGGEIRGLVLDLRDNPGGLLDQAVKIADIFVAEGLLVFSEGRDGGNRMEWHAKAEGTEPQYPIVVLVNGGSASASEIVAGALQDHSRALMLGAETFGKGSVQTIIPLDDGSGLRLTTALYYLPSGRSIQEVRVQPDVPVEPFSLEEIEAREADMGENAGQRFGEEDLKGHFSAKEPTEKKSEPDSSGDARRDAFQRQLELDRQLTRAVDLLESWRVFSNLDTPGGAS